MTDSTDLEPGDIRTFLDVFRDVNLRTRCRDLLRQALAPEIRRAELKRSALMGEIAGIDYVLSEVELARAIERGDNA